MKIALIGAMKSEIVFALSLLTDIKEKKINHFIFYQGKYKSHDLIVVESGIGKTASGMLIATMAYIYPDIEKVINIGVAGGMRGKVKIGDIIVISKASYGDVDVRSGGDYQYGQMCRFPLFFQADDYLMNIIKRKMKISYLIGSILTSDKFVTSEEECTILVESYFKGDNVLCFDMESAAYAQACHFLNKDFIAIRAISDVVGENHNQEFDLNLEDATNKSNQFIFELLDILSK